MNKRVNAASVVVGLFAFVLVISGPVSAHEGEDHGAEETVTTTQARSPEQQQKELKDRLEKRKAEQKVRLTTQQKTRLGERCKSSQGGLRSVEGRIKGIETSRNQVYANLTERLNNLSVKLKAKGVNTAKLDEQITSLTDQITAFKTDLTEYKQVIADLAAMDCQSDPEAFKAALEQARNLRKELSESSQNIKKYVKETIKPTLAEIRASLAAQEDDSADGGEAN